MVSEIKIYQVKDFVRKTMSGELDKEGSAQAVHDLTVLATFHKDHNILIDLRSTTLAPISMSETLQLAMEFASYKSVFKNKIANIIPADKERVLIAERFQACMQLQHFEYRFFTDFEKAIEWLSEVKDL